VAPFSPSPATGDEHQDDRGGLTISGELAGAHGGDSSEAIGPYTLLSTPQTHSKGQTGEPRHEAHLTTVMVAWPGVARCHDGAVVTWVVRRRTKQLKGGT
jgi:hypothetical protein